MNAVYLIDDKISVRRAVGEMLETFGFIVQLYDSAHSFLEGITPTNGGCIVADVRMPGMDGIELLHELSRRNISLPVVLISGYADVPMAVASIKAGAEDLIEKPIDDRRLVAAINRGMARSFDQHLAKKLIRPLEEAFSHLTPRQVEIFDLAGSGLTSQAIASSLGISVRTVESARAQIMEKMGAENATVLVRQAIRLGRIAP